ncbi:MAG: hypothetical protein ABJA98_12490 [Acidobacteriota bacterium]
MALGVDPTHAVQRWLDAVRAHLEAQQDRFRLKRVEGSHGGGAGPTAPTVDFVIRELGPGLGGLLFGPAD